MNILAIDQGTSATKALLVGPGNEVLGRAEVPVATTAVDGGGVEADPEELWRSVVSAGERALAAARAPAHAVALANQGETVLAWDKATGKPLSRAIVWQDRRSAAICERLRSREGELARITGLPLDPYFAAPKMTWLRENVTADGVVTTTDSWLLHRLGGGVRHRRGDRLPHDAARPGRDPVVRSGLRGVRPRRRGAPARRRLRRGDRGDPDFGNRASGTSRFRSPGSRWTSRRRSTRTAAYARATPSAPTGPGRSCSSRPGETAARSSAGLSASVAWRLAGTAAYCLDGQVYTAGSALRWLTEIGVLPAPADLDRVAGTVPDSGGVTFVPALAGLGAPQWAPHARGQLAGLQLSTGRGHIARAVAEGIAASVALLAGAAAADLGGPLTSLRVDGGLTRSRVLLQAQADLLQVPVLASRTPDATALGVAALASLALGEAGAAAG